MTQRAKELGVTVHRHTAQVHQTGALGQARQDRRFTEPQRRCDSLRQRQRTARKRHPGTSSTSDTPVMTDNSDIELSGQVFGALTY